jgi:hypothetical protein
MKISKDYLKKPKRDPHLHSPAHVLAEELRNLFNEPDNFKFYLGIALRTDHAVIRRIAGQVTEKKVENPAALFAYLIKQYNDGKKAKQSNDPENIKSP